VQHSGEIKKWWSGITIKQSFKIIIGVEGVKGPDNNSFVEK